MEVTRGLALRGASYCIASAASIFAVDIFVCTPVRSFVPTFTTSTKNHLENFISMFLIISIFIHNSVGGIV